MENMRHNVAAIGFTTTAPMENVMPTVHAGPPPDQIPVYLADHNPAASIEAVTAALSSFIHRGADEYRIQASVAKVLTAKGIPFQTEVALSATDRVDFLVDGCIAVEVKVRGSRMAVLRQLQRYARNERISGVVLAAARRTLLAGLPDELHGKPLTGVLLRGAGL